MFNILRGIIGLLPCPIYGLISGKGYNAIGCMCHGLDRFLKLARSLTHLFERSNCYKYILSTLQINAYHFCCLSLKDIKLV